MERTKKVSAEKNNPPPVEGEKITLAPRWKKLGGGSFRIQKANGSAKIIKPGEIFRAHPDEIPLGFRDLCQPLDGAVAWEDNKKSGKRTQPIPGVKPIYHLAPRVGTDSLFDILNPEGKVLNEVPLEEEVAKQLIADLSK
jgi:hypothetical protein